ncbi:MAG: hypothetical protein ACTHNZ_21080 [Trinickia sp.]|uniref:hypothetical protein n=1 Tax=Trinickia sp. TaxID=2571163 RepID=UPI003F822836
MQLRHASSWNRFADRNETNSGGAQAAKIIIPPIGEIDLERPFIEALFQKSTCRWSAPGFSRNIISFV